MKLRTEVDWLARWVLYMSCMIPVACDVKRGGTISEKISGRMGVAAGSGRMEVGRCLGLR